MRNNCQDKYEDHNHFEGILNLVTHDTPPAVTTPLI